MDIRRKGSLPSLALVAAALACGLTNFWAVAFDNPQAGWIVGTQGRIVKISF
jgi:hypothetical protein